MTNQAEQPDVMALAVEFAKKSAIACLALNKFGEENPIYKKRSAEAEGACSALLSALTTMQSKLDAAEARVRELEKLLVPDMCWDSDDAERQHGSIDEFLNDEICNGSVEVGAVFTIWQAKRLPSVTIKVTSIDENECEAEWEEIDRAALSKETPK